MLLQNTKKTILKYKIQKKSFCNFVKKFFVVRSQMGQAMLVAILMITAAALAIGLAVASLSSSEVKITVASRDASIAYYLAETCLEDTLMRFSRTNTSIPPTFTLPQGSCTIEVNGAGPYEIISTSHVGKATRKIRASVSVSNEVLNITSWGESY